MGAIGDLVAGYCSEKQVDEETHPFSLNVNGIGNEGIVFIGIDRKKRQALAMIRASSGEDCTSFIIVSIPLLYVPH